GGGSIFSEINPTESPHMSTSALGAVLEYLGKACAVWELEQLPDGQVLEWFVTVRDDAAFAALVQRHRPLVLGVCRRVLEDEPDADEESVARTAPEVQLARLRARAKPGSGAAQALCRRFGVKW